MTKKKIFICDDDQGIVDMLEMILDDTDNEIVTQTNSIHANEDLIREQPELLIIDLWMPVISGDQIIRWIRNDEQLKHMFIVCISASQDGRKIATEAGADIFLAKPFDIDELLSIVNEINTPET